jgi:peroxiredoxin
MKLPRHLATAMGLATVVVLGLLVALLWPHKLPPAPELPYVRLDGSAAHTRELRGQVVLVNFWATSCVSCVKKMPDLVALHQRFAARGYETLAIAMHYDTPAWVAHFAQSRKLPFTVAIDHTGELARGFGDVQLTPTTLLINRRGEIVKRWAGATDLVQVQALIEQLLRQPATP